MTLGDAVTALDHLAREQRAKGLNYAVVLLPWRKAGRRGAGDPMQVFPGLSGRFLGESESGVPLVDLALEDVERWVVRHGGPAPVANVTPPRGGEGEPTP